MTSLEHWPCCAANRIERVKPSVAIVSLGCSRNDVDSEELAGRLEADGGGLTEVISDAVDQGIPVVVGVPERHLPAWRVFTSGLAEEVPLGSPRLQQWLSRRGFGTRRDAVHATHYLNSAA